MRSVICSFCVGRALLYHQRESFYDCERSLCRGLQRWQLAALAGTSRQEQKAKRGQNGSNAPSKWPQWDGKHKGVKHGIQWAPQTQNGLKWYENKDVKHKFQSKNIIFLQWVCSIPPSNHSDWLTVLTLRYGLGQFLGTETLLKMLIALKYWALD